MSDLLKFIEENKVVSIFRGVPVEKTVDVAKALYDGGIRMFEITFAQNSGRKIEDTVEAIKLMDEYFGDKIVLGAGTVLTVEECEAAHKAGAKFILAPDVNVDVIKKALELNMGAIPGAMTPTEVITAYNAGATAVKLFPAGDLGINYLKSIKGPISHVPIMAVGAINSGNYKEFFKAGAMSVGIGSDLTNKQLIKDENYEELKLRAMRYEVEHE